jgi:hypothetical protein
VTPEALDALESARAERRARGEAFAARVAEALASGCRVRKVRAASRSYGRGADSTRTPAAWGAFDASGALRYRIESGGALRYGERSTWHVERVAEDGGAGPRVAYARSRAEAGAKALALLAEAEA